jgi:hypothetical protein
MKDARRYRFHSRLYGGVFRNLRFTGNCEWLAWTLKDISGRERIGEFAVGLAVHIHGRSKLWKRMCPRGHCGLWISPESLLDFSLDASAFVYSLDGGYFHYTENVAVPHKLSNCDQTIRGYDLLLQQLGQSNYEGMADLAGRTPADAQALRICLLTGSGPGFKVARLVSWKVRLCS